jgi:hypothetical protein
MMMPRKRIAEAASLGGGAGHILTMLGCLLMARIHPEIRKKRIKLDNKDGLDRTWIEELMDFENKTVTHQTSPVLTRQVQLGMHQISPVWTGQVRSVTVSRPKSPNFTNQ